MRGPVMMIDMIPLICTEDCSRYHYDRFSLTYTLFVPAVLDRDDSQCIAKTTSILSTSRKRASRPQSLAPYPK